jgi:hypothetical protein
MDKSNRTKVVADWLAIIRAEYSEVPGLRLTIREAERLWGLEAHVCEAILETLVASSFLRRTKQDQYVRADGDR